ncbi:MAG: 3-isopropylmalate dehydrogenase [bacterium]|nr:3-isopropylmalate dehydrogenase [bacterium]
MSLEYTKKKREFNLLVLPGDGVGQEVVNEAIKIIDVINEITDIKIKYEFDYIGGACLDKFNESIRTETIKKALKVNAVLLGAVGSPKWDKQQPEKALLTLRKKMNVFANIRPIKDYFNNNVDILFVRELTGGIYFGPKKLIQTKKEYIAKDVLVYKEHEIKRVLKVAFELANNRNKNLVSVDKANVLISSKLWRELANKISQEYPQVKLRHMLVDSFAYNLIKNPKDFDVVVSENLFGDILTDEAAVLVKSLGMLPSASIGYKSNNGLYRGLYEPVHGSAPDIANQNIANPIATILSVSLMFKYSFNLPYISILIEKAVMENLKQGVLTKDLSNNNYYHTTSEVGENIKNIFKSLLKQELQVLKSQKL